MRPVLLTERVALLCGDSKALDLGEGTVDAVVCDPPYELGFMGKRWDATGIAYDVELWKGILRALKPGGHLLAFGGTRTYHRMACAIEDAGFEIRDSLHWVYGSGFPKSLNVSKAIDARLGAERPIVGANPNHRAVSGVEYEGVYAGGNTGAAFLTATATTAAQAWDGWGTALKPAHEPIILARKPLDGTVADQVLATGTGALNVDGCRIGRAEGDVSGWSKTGSEESENFSMSGKNYARAPKPDADGRWPANILFDEDAAAELDAQSGRSKSTPQPRRRTGARQMEGWGLAADSVSPPLYDDSGGASRFFGVFRYCAKPSARERDYGCEALPERSGGEATDRVDGSAGLESPRAGAGRRGGRRNVHPTVKPVELMRWLCRLVTPPGGTILDPFAGSGTTGIAAVRENFNFIGVEQSPEYVEIARARIARAMEDKSK